VGTRRRIANADDRTLGEIAGLAAVLTQEQIAAYYGVSRRTVSAWLQDQRFREAYEMGRARAIKEVATSLLNAAKNGNITAMIFYLKTQAKWSERVEVAEVAKTGRLPLDIVPALAAITGLRPEDFDLSRLPSEPPANGKQR
jgi:transcriptional regulator with XRE-family HTH domain